MVVEEVSVIDVDYNSGSSNSCIFWEIEVMGNTGSDVGKFVGRFITVVCGGVLLSIKHMRCYRCVRFDKIEEIKIDNDELRNNKNIK